MIVVNQDICIFSFPFTTSFFKTGTKLFEEGMQITKKNSLSKSYYCLTSVWYRGYYKPKLTQEVTLMLRDWETIRRISFILILGMNGMSYYCFAKDKKRSKSRGRRISERKLLLSAIFFGGVGAFLAMKQSRHKTRHFYFNVIVRLSALGTLAATVWLIRVGL